VSFAWSGSASARMFQKVASTATAYPGATVSSPPGQTKPRATGPEREQEDEDWELENSPTSQRLPS